MCLRFSYTRGMKEVLLHLQKYFNIATLGDITWAHAVNSQAKLQRFLHDPQTMIIEADIRISPRGDAVVTHPPEVDSDLSFEALLQAIASSKQCLKLDFKDPEILYPCLIKLSEARLVQPVIVNADVLQGHGGYRSKFNAPGFLALCKQLYPQGILSPGWTTHPDIAYTQDNIDEMLALCQDIAQVTFPIRARLLPASWEHVSRLLQHDGSSLTIWNGEPVDEELHRWLQVHTDTTKTCYDLVYKKGNL